MQIELSKKSAKLIDDYINGRQELSFPIYQKLRKQLNLCIEELENLVWNRTCAPSQYDKLAKRLKDYEKMEKEMIKVFKFYKELNGDNNRKEFYKVGTQDEEEEPVMKMKLIKVHKKDGLSLSEAMSVFQKALIKAGIANYRNKYGDKPRASVKTGEPIQFKINIGQIPEIKRITEIMEKKYPEFTLHHTSKTETVWTLFEEL